MSIWIAYMIAAFGGVLWLFSRSDWEGQGWLYYEQQTGAADWPYLYCADSRAWTGLTDVIEIAPGASSQWLVQDAAVRRVGYGAPFDAAISEVDEERFRIADRRYSGDAKTFGF